MVGDRQPREALSDARLVCSLEGLPSWGVGCFCLSGGPDLPLADLTLLAVGPRGLDWTDTLLTSGLAKPVLPGGFAGISEKGALFLLGVLDRQSEPEVVIDRFLTWSGKPLCKSKHGEGTDSVSQHVDG